MNPNPNKHEHALTLDGQVAAPSLKAVRQTADMYRLSPTAATAIENEVTAVVKGWKDRADALGMSRPEVLRMEGVFLA